MKLLRVFAIIATLSCLVCSAFLTIIFALGITLVPHTIENGKSIDDSFVIAAKYVDSFLTKSGRLPSQDEFNSWKMAQVGARLQGINLELPIQAPEKVISSFGTPPNNGYVLSTWRGDWTEYYYSWARESTVDSALGLYGSSIGLVALFAFGSFVFWHAAKKLHATRSKTQNLAAP